MDIKIFDVESLYRCKSCGAKWGEPHKHLSFYDLPSVEGNGVKL